MINYRNPDYSDLPGRRSKSHLYERVEPSKASIDVSILTPYYNTEALFVETAVSLQNQSLQNWEWILVDDGSTDPVSMDRLRRVAGSDSRIHLVTQENAGPAAARNTAFRHSNGRYLCLLDSDDMVEPTYLEKCAWFLDSNPEFAFCNAWSVFFGEQESLCRIGFELGETHLRANVGPPISVIRRLAYEACGGFDESIRFGHEDWDFWLAMAKAGHWGYTLPEFLQWYRKRSGGRYEQIMRSKDTNTAFEKYIHNKYSGLAGSFPSPQRRPPQPFELIETVASVTNSLARGMTGQRVMFIVPWMVTGGADRVNLDLVAGLVGHGYDVTVCATLRTEHAWKYRFSRLTPDVFVLPDFLHQSDYPRFLSYLIASRGIDTVVITGSTIGYLLLPYLRASSPGVSFVDLCHVEELHWQNGGHPRFAVGYQDALDLNIVTTAHLAHWMEETGADKSRIRVLYTGVKERETATILAERSSIRTELGIPEDMPVIIFAGRICRQKRPAVLAEILKASRDAGLAFRALIIGEGDQRLMIEELIRKYRLQTCVTMLGSVPHERWLSLLAASDVFLLPSEYEGISIALLEAMAAGVVPVVSRVGGQEEVVEDGAGFLIRHGDDECSHYVEALRLLFGEPEQRRVMAEKSRAIISRRFSDRVTVSNFMAMLDESLSLVASAPRQVITLGLAKELARFAMEFNRVSNAADLLWSQVYNSDKNGPEPMPPEARVLLKLVGLLRKTRFVRMILKNSFLRRIGRCLLAKLEGEPTAVI